MTANEVPIQVLRMLARGQPMSINQIVKEMQAPMRAIWHTVIGLEKNGYVTRLNSHIHITQEGRLFLLSEDIRASGNSSIDNLKRLGAPSGPTLFTMLENAWKYDKSVLVIPALLAFIALWLFGFRQEPDIPFYIVSSIMALVILGFYLRFAIHRVPQFMRLVVFRFGICVGERGPGPVLLIPIADLVYEVDMRVHPLEVSQGGCMTKDHVMINVDIILYWQVAQTMWNLTQVTDTNESLRLLTTAQLREVIDHFPFQEIQMQREHINDMLQQKVNAICAIWQWGVTVTAIRIRKITPPPEVIASMQLEAIAKLKSRATKTEADAYHAAQVIKAEGDALALRKLNEVAATLDDKMLLLRYLDTLSELGKSSSSKLILPMELIDLVRPFAEKIQVHGDIHSPSSAPHNGHQGT